MEAATSTIESEILAMLKRRPMNLMELTYGNSRNSPLLESTLRKMEKDGLIEKTDTGNEWRIIHQ